MLALMLSVPAGAATSVTVGITFGNAPPPPAIIFRGEPSLVVMPHTDLWYYEGPCSYDYFRYGRNFYIYNGGYWYRGPQYRGPFVAIHEADVPRMFYSLHDRGYHWRHGWKNAPPGQVKKMERGEGHKGGHDQGHGHGHNKH